jgi:hypothetical protein
MAAQALLLMDEAEHYLAIAEIKASAIHAIVTASYPAFFKNPPTPSDKPLGKSAKATRLKL